MGRRRRRRCGRLGGILLPTSICLVYGFLEPRATIGGQPPFDSPDRDEISRWIVELDARQHSVRENAQKRLIAARERAAQEVARTVVEGGPEARIRARKIILSQLDNDAVRQRAIATLDIADRSDSRSMASRANALLVLLERPVLARLNARMTVGFHEDGRVKSLANTGDPDKWLKNPELSHLAEFRRLTQLDLSGKETDHLYTQSPISDVGLIHLSSLQSLEHLNLEGTLITDDGLKYLAGLTKLRSIVLRWTRVTGRGLHHLRDLRELETLDLSSSEFARSAELGELKTLQRLNISDTPLSDTGLADIAKLNGLKILLLSFHGSKLQPPQFTDAGVAHLRSCRALEEIDLGSSRVGDAALAGLSGATKLRTLRLYNCRRVTDTGLQYLQPLSHLESLDLWGATLTGNGLRYLDGMTSLRTLRLDSVRGAAINHLPELPSLEVFVGHCTHRNFRIPHLSRSTRLRRFDFSPITDDILSQLESCQRLESLKCSDLVTDVGAKSLKKIHSLREITFENSRLSDSGLSDLCSLPRLSSLSLYGTEVTDAGIPHLFGLKSLRELTLAHTRITDSGAFELIKCKTLRSLVLDNTRVTEHGLQRLRGAMSECKIFPLPKQ
jgi:Leucine-rich repeat (LRR) protein